MKDRYQTKEVMPGVFEVRLAYGNDTVGFFGGGLIDYSLWYLAGPHPTLVEPGPTTVAQIGIEAITGLGFDPQEIEYVIPSHIHVDHGGACGYLIERLPKAKAVIHARGAEHMRDPSRLITGTAAVFGDTWEDLFGPVLPVPDERMITVDDGETFDLGGRRHRIVYMPGHAVNHIGLYDQERSAIYSGHGLGMFRPDSPLPDPPSTLPFFDVAAALSSMARARALNLKLVLYSHYGARGGDPKEAIELAEKVTREIGDVVARGTKEGTSQDEIENRVKAYYYGEAARSPRSFGPMVRAYITYFQRNLSP